MICLKAQIEEGKGFGQNPIRMHHVSTIGHWFSNRDNFPLGDICQYLKQYLDTYSIQYKQLCSPIVTLRGWENCFQTSISPTSLCIGIMQDCSSDADWASSDSGRPRDSENQKLLLVLILQVLFFGSLFE